VLTLSFSFSHQDTFSLSFSLVDENLLSFSCSFSHLLVSVTFPSFHILLSFRRPIFVFDALFDRMPGLFKRLLTIILNLLSSTQSHSTQYALLSAEQHAHFRCKLRLSDEK